MTTTDRPSVSSVAQGAATARTLRKDAARNRASLLAAAREVFAERGLDASLDDIAARAGVGVGTAYRHFANKYLLAQAVFAQAVDTIVAAAETGSRAEDPWQGVVGFLEAALEAQTADRGLREVIIGGHDPEQMAAVHDRMIGPLTTMFDRARASGQIRADAEPSDLGAITSMLFAVADLGGDNRPDLWRRYLPMALEGLRGVGEMPVPPLSTEEMRTAMYAHKQRMQQRCAVTAVPLD